jgi:hypothetical protein
MKRIWKVVTVLAVVGLVCLAGWQWNVDRKINSETIRQSGRLQVAIELAKVERDSIIAKKLIHEYNAQPHHLPLNEEDVSIINKIHTLSLSKGRKAVIVWFDANLNIVGLSPDAEQIIDAALNRVRAGGKDINLTKDEIDKGKYFLRSYSN